MYSEHKEVFVNYLVQLSALIEKLEGYTGEENILPQARLADDMFPLGVQAKVATNFALRGCCNPAGVKIPEYGVDTNSLADIRLYIERAIAFIKSLDSPTSEQRECEDRAGFNKIKMPASKYVSLFVLPNFFFHISMVYAIAKNRGASVTKGDFDGIHHYPEDFSWER